MDMILLFLAKPVDKHGVSHITYPALACLSRLARYRQHTVRSNHYQIISTNFQIIINDKVWSHLCLRNLLKIATRQYLGTKFDMLFEIAESVEIQLFYPKILDFTPKHYSVVTFVHINLPIKPTFLL